MQMNSTVAQLGVFLALLAPVPLMAQDADSVRPATSSEVERPAYDPEDPTDVVDLIGAHDQTSIFAEILAKSGLSSDLRRRNSEVTVFVPTNAAFEYLSPEALSEIRSDDTAALHFVARHIVKKSLASADFAANDGTEDLAANALVLSAEHGLFVDEAEVIEADLAGTNGRVHVIDRSLSHYLP